jgi:serine/threonine protein phosphatase PrpC
LFSYAAEHQERWHLYKKPLFPGCALVAVLVDAHGRKLYTANTGDCAAMLHFGAAPPIGSLVVGFPEVPGAAPAAPLSPPSSGAAVLSRAHKPADMGELLRVCGTERGFVEVHGQRVTPDNSAAVASLVVEAQALGRKALYRINRDVSLSRAIGDWDLKEFGVIATPDVTVYAFSPEECGRVALVMATDGVWDVLDPDDVCSLLLADHPEVLAASTKADRTAAAEVAAGALVSAAFGVVKNNDDVTALVASFDLTAKAEPKTEPAGGWPKKDSVPKDEIAEGGATAEAKAEATEAKATEEGGGGSGGACAMVKQTAESTAEPPGTQTLP